LAADPAYERIRRAIVSGQLHPGARLVEADLTETFATSRTAVRTALVRLEQEGVVEHERNRGAKVRVIDEAEAVEIYEARTALESFAAGRAAKVSSKVERTTLLRLMDRIEREVAGGNLDVASALNSELHTGIVVMARHATVEKLVASLNTHLVRFRYRTMMHPDRPDKSVQEHRAVVEAIARGDQNAAASAMRIHLETVTESLRRPVPTQPD
jgi:DNA-binding GntR family transcriptional regulator